MGGVLGVVLISSVISGGITEHSSRLEPECLSFMLPDSVVEKESMVHALNLRLICQEYT